MKLYRGKRFLAIRIGNFCFGFGRPSGQLEEDILLEGIDRSRRHRI